MIAIVVGDVGQLHVPREPLRVQFLKRLRGERRFDGVDALIAQMSNDVDDARAVAAACA